MGKVSTPKTPKTPRTVKKPKTPKGSSTKRKEPQQEGDGEVAAAGKENEVKKAKQQPDLKNFFKPLEKPAPPPTVPHCMPEDSRFKNYFQFKTGVTLAPVLVRKPLTDDERFDLLKIQCEESNYLKECNLMKTKKSASNTDVLKAKYFHFHDNYRPPYYGTWRHRSKAINGRRPFSRKENTINYEYDSDEDWEDEPDDADECKSEDDKLEREEEPEVEEEDNDGFFVDHGYLSTDEGSGAEDNDLLVVEKKINERVQSEAKVVETDDQRRQRLTQKAEEWKDQQRQKERRYKKRHLIPTVYLPADNVVHHPVLHRNILPGVLFDYSKIVMKSLVALDDNNGEKAVENETPVLAKSNKLDKPPVQIA